MKLKLNIAIMLLVCIAFVAADHIDAPAVQGGASDITDFYVFEGSNTANLVFVANVQGLLSPGETGGASFEENTLVEINIDTDGDNVEDLVIQAIPRDGQMYFFGPTLPTANGLNSTIDEDATRSVVDITPYGISPIIGSQNGMKVFAGPRDDPFFFDFAQYSAILGGTATGFNNPGSDTFAGTNVLSIVIEVPKSLVGGSGAITAWVESKSKQ